MIDQRFAGFSLEEIPSGLAGYFQVNTLQALQLDLGNQMSTRRLYGLDSSLSKLRKMGILSLMTLLRLLFWVKVMLTNSKKSRYSCRLAKMRKEVMRLRGMKMSRVNLSKYSKIRLTIDKEAQIMSTRYLAMSTSIFARSKTY